MKKYRFPLALAVLFSTFSLTVHGAEEIEHSPESVIKSALSFIKPDAGSAEQSKCMQNFNKLDEKNKEIYVKSARLLFDMNSIVQGMMDEKSWECIMKNEELKKVMLYGLNCKDIVMFEEKYKGDKKAILEHLKKSIYFGGVAFWAKLS